MRVNLVQESARHLQMTRARQMRVDTRDLPEAETWHAETLDLVLKKARKQQFYPGSPSL